MAVLGVWTVNCFRVWKGILKLSRILASRLDATLFLSGWWTVRMFLLAFQIFKLYNFFLAFQQHQFCLNPILEQRVMIKTLRRVQKSSWKPEKRQDDVALSARSVAISRSVPEYEIQFLLRFWIGWPSVQTVLPWRPDVLQWWSF
jgi:hypothetical protein